MIAVALTIAGSDSGGGAGIQADLATFLDHGVHGCAAITAVTAQNSLGVSWVGPVPTEGLLAQLDAVLSDLNPKAIKVGMLVDRGRVELVAARLAELAAPIVVDPVMASSSGTRLLAEDAVEAMRDKLFPLAALVTPNLSELEMLGGQAWLARAPIPVLVKGGHGEGNLLRDLLVFPDGRRRVYAHPRVHTRNSRGTGCILSSAIAAGLAKGTGLERAIDDAIAYLEGLLRRSADHRLGAGNGPLLHGPLSVSAMAGYGADFEESP